MHTATAQTSQCDQRGFALIALLAILGTGMLYFLVTRLDAAAAHRERDEVTTRALAEAKTALIAYAVSIDLSGTGRPGDLPCPDLDNDGIAESRESPQKSCGNATGSNPEKRLGRLPWKSLGLPDLVDGYGERLWYAVSNNFKELSPTKPLNSDTLGTITIRDGTGTRIYDANATATTGVVAVIIAPGPPIVRQDDLQQDRSATNINIATHFLDNIAPEDNPDFAEDNADFKDSTANGFFSGPVPDPTDPARVLANDRILVITRDEIIAAIEKRVAAEAMKCLADYAAVPANGGRYPWAADMAASAGGDYDDSLDARFGRFPELLCATAADADSISKTPFPGICAEKPLGSNPAMSIVWPATCTATNQWFKDNWREQVFYAIAAAYAPETGAPSCGTGTCLSVDGVSGKQVTVIVAGRKVDKKDRIDKSDPTQYLEDINSAGATSYVTKSTNPPFNDRVLYR